MATVFLSIAGGLAIFAVYVYIIREAGKADNFSEEDKIIKDKE